MSDGPGLPSCKRNSRKPEPNSSGPRLLIQISKILTAQIKDLTGALNSAGPAGPAFTALAAMSFDQGSPITVAGKAAQLTIANPQGYLMVDDGSNRYLFATAAANEMAKQGFTRNTVRLGDQVTVTGLLSAGGQQIEGAIAASAITISKPDGTLIFNRSAITQ